MKTYSFILVLAALALASCGTAYRGTQTPDAVYYSPAQENAPSQGDHSGMAAAQDSEGGQYVTYDDGSASGGYADDYDDYYSRRINMFDRGDYFATNYYMSSPWSLGFSPYYSMGLGYNPFAFSYPSLSLGLGFGSPWGAWYRPSYAFGGWYSPFYTPYSYFPGYYGGYYGGGYGYYGGKYISVSPRPASSVGPRRSINSRGAQGGTAVSPASGVSAPRRVFTTNGSRETPAGVSSGTRRVFRSRPGEHPVNVNPNVRSGERPSRSIFRSNSTINRSSESRSVRPARTFERNTNTYRVEQSAPSFNRSSGSQSAPVRSFSSPRGRR